jgi:1-acyl-sn-glycerol-3-phosphate acyltransferase
MSDPETPAGGPGSDPAPSPGEPAGAPQLRVFPGRRPRGLGPSSTPSVGSPDSLLVRLQTLEAQVEEALARSRPRASGVGEDLLVEALNTTIGLYAEARHRLARVRELVRRTRMLGRGLALDEFGYDPDAAGWVEPILDLVFRYWWRVDVVQPERVPARGPVVLVANHGGTLLPYDALMVATALRLAHPLRRRARPLVENFLYNAPHLGTFLARIGAVRADRANARRLLADGAAVIVFPEGERGLGKPYRDRYRLERFGRGGFIRLCLETGAALVPVAVIGAEEVHPLIARVVTPGRLLGLPYLPITPTFPWLGLLGLVPLPTKWTIRFGEPIDLAGVHDAADPEDPALVGRLREEVRQRIQRMLLESLRRRRSIFFG